MIISSQGLLFKKKIFQDVADIWTELHYSLGNEVSVNFLLQIFIDALNGHSQYDTIPSEANLVEFQSAFENILLNKNQVKFVLFYFPSKLKFILQFISFQPLDNSCYSNLSKISLLIKRIVLLNIENDDFSIYFLSTFCVFVNNLSSVKSEYSLFPGVTLLRSLNLIIMELKANELPFDIFLKIFLEVLEIISNKMLKLIE